MDNSVEDESGGGDQWPALANELTGKIGAGSHSPRHLRWSDCSTPAVINSIKPFRRDPWVTSAQSSGGSNCATMEAADLVRRSSSPGEHNPQRLIPSRIALAISRQNKHLSLYICLVDIAQ